MAQLHDAMTLEVANVFVIDKSAGGETAKAPARRSAFASFSEDDEPADHDAATANNKRLLFHASKVFNFVGLLSRGILPPKVVVSKVNPSSPFSFSFSFFVFAFTFAFAFILCIRSTDN